MAQPRDSPLDILYEVGNYQIIEALIRILDHVDEKCGQRAAEVIQRILAAEAEQVYVDYLRTLTTLKHQRYAITDRNADDLDAEAYTVVKGIDVTTIREMAAAELTRRGVAVPVKPQ